MLLPHRTAILAFLVLAGCSAEEPAPPSEPAPQGTVVLDEAQQANAGVRTMEARSTDVHPTASFPATLAPPDTGMADVGSIVEGRVERVLVVEGDRVRQGQELARIHSHELTAALRDLTSAEARVGYASASLERSLRLLEAGAVSREEVERRRADAAAAGAERDRAAEVVAHLDPSPDGEVTVRAPRAGVVLAARARPSQAVTPGTPLFIVGPEETLWATAYVPESEAVPLEPGGEAYVRFRALPDTVVVGRVVAVGRGVDPDTRTVSVRVELSRVPRGVRSGMYVTVGLVQGPSVPGVELPMASVQRMDGRDVVFLAEADGRYRPVEVQTRVSAPDRLVVQGIEEGAQVVVEGAYVLKATMDQAAVAGEEG